MALATWSRREDLFMSETEFPLLLSSSQKFAFPAIGRLFQWSNPFRTFNYHGRRQPALLVIWTLLFIGYFPTSMQTEQVNGQSDNSWLDREESCPTCARERAISVLKEDEVKRWRIESTKQQILDRLDMEDRPPRVKTKEQIVDLHLGHDLPANVVLTDPATVEQIRQMILFPAKIFRRHRNHPHHHIVTLTLKFPIAEDMVQSVLHSAVLWTAKGTNQTVEWESTEVTSTVDGQIESHPRHRYLSLSVDTDSNVEHSQHPKPYLIIQIDPSLKRLDQLNARYSRHKRNTTPRCGTNVNAQCCRESLFVSFKDVGWDDWIVAPDGFHAFYCRGSCRTFTAPATSAHTHASLLQKLLSRERVPVEARNHLAPCCAPTRLSPLTIFYSDENNVIKQRTLPNMIVESCGCTL